MLPPSTATAPGAQVEAQGRGTGHATDASEALFGKRLSGQRRSAAAKKARPLGLADNEDTEGHTAAAWEALGFADARRARPRTLG